MNENTEINENIKMEKQKAKIKGMDRRLFVGMGVGGAAATLIGADKALAHNEPNYAGSVYYTKESPGRWEKKVAGHLPNLTLKTEGGKRMIEVTTAHEMNPYAHYIVKHILLDQSLTIIGEKMFDPAKDKAAISQFELGEQQGKVYAISMCNQHDTWLGSLAL